jgi:hypothetical protein
MKLTRNKSLSLIAVLVFFVVYNVVVFFAPFERGTNFWIGYAFTVVSILLTTGVGFYALGHEGMVSKFFGFPLLYMAWYYFVAQLIVGFVFMLFPVSPYWIEIVVSVPLLGFCLIGLLSTDIGKEEAERLDVKIREKVSYIKTLHSHVNGMIPKTEDLSLKQALKNLSETIRYSDPMSNAQLAPIENEITAKVTHLKEIFGEKLEIDDAMTLCDEIQQLFDERNRNCKLLK